MRVVRNGRTLKTKPSQLRANRAYYQRHRDRLKADALRRYHERRRIDNARTVWTKMN